LQKPAKALPPIPLPVALILPDLPRDLFAPDAQAKVAKLTIDLPSAWVLPQLSSGNISLRVVDLIPYFPKDVLRQPVPHIPDTQTITLPLAQIVASIPREVFEVKHQSAVDLNGPDFAMLPKLVDDVPAKKAAVAVAPPVEVMPPIARVAVTAPSQPVKAPSQPVWIGLRSLINVIPDHLLIQPRSVVSGQVEAGARAALPLEPILPQLKTACVKLPLSTIVAAMPAPLFISPLPRDLSEAVVLPLDEIVPQIPPDVFASAMGAPHPDHIESSGFDNIPSPFIEANATALAPARPVAPAVPVAVPARVPVPVQAAVAVPVQAPVTVPKSVPTEISTAALEDEKFSMFSEKPAASAPPPVVVKPPVAAPVPPPAKPAAPAPPQTPVKLAPAVLEPVTGVSCWIPTGGLDEQKYLVNLNSCDADNLMQIHGIGPAMAKRIIEFRDAHGPFKSLEELRQVPGIGRKTFRALTGIGPRKLNRMLGVPEDRELSLPEVVRLVCELPGVDGCIVALEDGLFVTGQLPPPLDKNTVSAFGPQLFKRMGRYVRELNIGQMHRLTLFTDQRPVSVFHEGEVYLIVVHPAKRYSKALLRKCERVTREIAALCRQRVTV
jgi:competence protein ComEA